MAKFKINCQNTQHAIKKQLKLRQRCLLNKFEQFAYLGCTSTKFNICANLLDWQLFYLAAPLYVTLIITCHAYLSLVANVGLVRIKIKIVSTHIYLLVNNNSYTTLSHRFSSVKYLGDDYCYERTKINPWLLTSFFHTLALVRCRTDFPI